MSRVNKVRIVIIIILLFLLCALYYSDLTKKIKEGIYFLIIIIGVFSYLSVQAYFPRYCKKCKIKMWAHYKNDSIVPDYYYCLKCNCKEKTHMYSGENI